MSKRVRSFAKAISWRLLASTITLMIIWVATGNLKLSGLIGGSDFLIKILVYYFHERIWASISWGRSSNNIIHKENNVESSNNHIN